MFRVVMLTCLLLASGVMALYHRTAPTTPADLCFSNQSRINILDPQQMSWASDMRVCRNVWEGLYRYDPVTLAPIPGMALTPPEISPDGTVYDFHLRADGRWSNGDPVVAADFVRGWRRALEPGTAADYADTIAGHIAGATEYYDWRNDDVRRLASFEGDPRQRDMFLQQHAAEMERHWQDVGIRAENDHLLRIELRRPTPYFLELTLLTALMPIHSSIELLRDSRSGRGIDDDGLVIYDSQWTKPDYHRNGYPGLITNGAYLIAEWQFRRRLRLRVNPYHYDSGRTALRTVDIMMFENANTAFQAYETGVIDWLTDISVDYTGALLEQHRRGQRPDLSIVPAFGTYYYNFNCRDAVLPDGQPNPFIDARVRRAFALTVDRARLCATVVEKNNPPLSGFVPPGQIPGYPSIVGLPYDPELGRRLLDQAGYADRATFPPVTILYNTGQNHERLAEAVAHMWHENLAVSVNLEAQEAKTFAENKAKHNFHIARASWYGDYADPTTFLDIFTSANGNNDSGYHSPQYDALLQRAARCHDAQQRLELLAQAEKLLVTEDLPLVPLFQYTNLQAHRSHLRGIHPNAREIYPLRALWVQR